MTRRIRMSEARPQRARLLPIWRALFKENSRLSRERFSQPLAPMAVQRLEALTKEFCFSVKCGDLQVINGNWYVTHTGLLRLSRRRKCRGIHVEAVDSMCD